MKKEYNSLEIRLMYLCEEDVITTSGSASNTPSDNDIIGDDIF